MGAKNKAEHDKHRSVLVGVAVCESIECVNVCARFVFVPLCACAVFDKSFQFWGWKSIHPSTSNSDDFSHRIRLNFGEGDFFAR